MRTLRQLPVVVFIAFCTQAVPSALGRSSDVPPTVYSVTPTSLTFGKVQQGKASGAMVVTITNISAPDPSTGLAPYALPVPTIAGNDFDLTYPQSTSVQWCGEQNQADDPGAVHYPLLMTLPAGQSCTVWVRFAPTRVGALSNRLTLSQGGSSKTYTVALSGTGTPAPPSTPKRTIRISTLRLLFDQRIATEKRLLQDRIHDEDVEKEALQPLLVEAGARLNTALSQEAGATSATAQAEAALALVQGQLNVIARTERAIPPAVKPFADRRDRLAAEVERLNGLVLGGDDGLLAQLASARSQLVKAEQSLDARLPRNDGTEVAAETGRLNRALASLDEQVLALEKQQLHADDELDLAQRSLGRLFEKRNDLDSRLIDDAQALAALDFSLDDVEVEADGKVVYDVRVATPYKQLEALNAKLAVAKTNLARLNSRRNEVTRAFLDAQDAVGQARWRLAGQIIRVSRLKFATDVAYIAYDVVKSTIQGGPIGAVTEGLKKAVEIELSQAAGSGSGIEPGSIEAEFNASYGAALKNGLSLENLARVGGERVLKEGVSKTAKDILNAKIGPLVFTKVYGEIPALYTEGVGRIVAAKSDTSALLVDAGLATQEDVAITRKLRQLVGLQKGVKPSAGGLASGLAKDLSKAIIKAGFDAQERDAWYDYFASDVTARAYYALWAKVSNDYWDRYDAYQQLLASKEDLIAGYDPANGTRTVLSVPFAEDAAIIVVLGLGQSKSGAPVGLDIVLGGKQLTYAGKNRYELGAGALAGAGHQVVLEVH